MGGLPMRKNKAPEPIKTCPLIDRPCLKSGCEIYNEMLNRCGISITEYNLYRLSEALRMQFESEDRPGT